MDSISNVTFSALTSSQYLKPVRMHYSQNGVPRTSDMMKRSDGVGIVIYNISRQVLVFVQQFRPAIYYSNIAEEDRCGKVETSKYPGTLGFTLETCGGIVDKNKSLTEIAREEILEECGYDVPLENLQQIVSFRSGVEFSGNRHTLFYTEVTDDMRISEGGGLESEGEMTEVIEMTVEEVKNYLKQDDVSSPVNFYFAMMWFLYNKHPK